MQHLQAARFVRRSLDAMARGYFQRKPQQVSAFLQQAAVSDDDQPARQVKLRNLHAQVRTDPRGLPGRENECHGAGECEFRRRH